MSKTSCEIHFDNNPSRVFYGGQLMCGRVVLKLYKEKTIRGIYVKIIGRGHCRWRTGAGNTNKTNIGEEYYLNEKTFFVGGESGEVVVSPGVHNYTFICMLPAALPTSVEGKIGSIRYFVIVHIDRPVWSHQEFREHFTVIKALNLNDDLVLRYPHVRTEGKKYFICCLLCCETGPLFIRARIPVGGYTPGQPIELSLEINNKSDQTFDNFNIQIIKNIQYYTHANSSVTKNEVVVLKSMTCGGCEKNQSRTHTVHITVPPVPPTDESTSNIVKVSYRLQIRGTADCCRDDPFLFIPIKIGTYPILVSNTFNRNTTITRQPASSNALPSVPASSTVPDCDGIDPPTYEEAISGYSVEVDGKVFKPSYPVFRRTPSYSTVSNN